MSEFGLAPDEPYMSLLSFAGRQYLIHSETGEAIALDKLEAPWRLHADDEGCVYLSAGEHVDWAANLMPHPIYKRGS